MRHDPALSIQARFAKRSLHARLVQEHREGPVRANVRPVPDLLPGFEPTTVAFVPRALTVLVLDVVQAVVAEQDAPAGLEHAFALRGDRTERLRIERGEEEHARDRIARAVGYPVRQR